MSVFVSFCRVAMWKSARELKIGKDSEAKASVMATVKRLKAVASASKGDLSMRLSFPSSDQNIQTLNFHLH